MGSEEITHPVQTDDKAEVPAAPQRVAAEPENSHTVAHVAKPSRLKNNWIIAAILIVFVSGIVCSVGPAQFLKFLYNPAAIVLVVILMLEYILLQGRDRTRIYKIELEKLHEKRNQDIEFMRNLEQELNHLDESLSPLIQTLSGDASINLQRVRDDLSTLRKGLNDKL